MNREEAKEFVKKQEPDFLTPAKKKVNGKISYICPSCGNGSGQSGDGIARHRDKYKCFVCGLSEDVIGLWKISQGITDYNEVFNSIYEHYNVKIDETAKQENKERRSATDPGAAAPQRSQKDLPTFTDFFLKANKDIDKTDYHRGISKDTLNYYKVGYIEEWRAPGRTSAPYSPRLIVPISEYTYLARDTRKELTEKQKEFEKMHIKSTEEVEGSAWIFNKKAIDTTEKNIIVVEGEIDALSVIDAGGEAVGLGSTANIKIFLEYLKKHKPKRALILSLDNDQEKEDGSKPGQTAENKLAEGLEEMKIPFYRYNIAGKYKDANEHLQADREGFIKEVIKAENIEKDRKREQYEQAAAINHINEFLNGINEEANTPCISTGFKQLDKSLDGGLYKGLYIIGAISSLGKTTIVLQIADQIAENGQDVIIFSLEMERSELMSKSISRNTLKEVLESGEDISNAKTARGITSGSRYINYSEKEQKIIKSSIIRYAKYAGHLYIYEGEGEVGADQIRETIKDHISITGNKPVVIIDYLQILAPYDVRASDKQNIDKAVLELKRITRKYKIPVIVISSLNRQNYNTKISMEAFKESGAIEYSSDVLIGLQLEGVGESGFDVDKAKRENPRHIEAVILKNRNGRTGDKIGLEYYTLFNYFMEAEKSIKDIKRDTSNFKRV